MDAVRLDVADWNDGSFAETGGSIADDYFAVTPALSWRPVQQTVLRFNYRYAWHRDLLGNPAARSASVLVGLSSYF